ncbi:MAG: hypothetical protein AAF749_11600 [Pseudomonadota bacterium]
MTDDTKPPRRKKRYILLGCIAGALLLYWYWLVLLVLFFLVCILAVVYAKFGQKVAIVSSVVSLLVLISVQLHWNSGETVCLSDPTHPYLWKMIRTDPSSTSGSMSSSDGSVSISFSAKSDDMIPGAHFAAVTVAGEATLLPLRFDQRRSLPKDIRFLEGFDTPQPAIGAQFYVPEDAEFRASAPFDGEETTFSVADLPVLVQSEEDIFTPIGLLSGSITLGETAMPRPAKFLARNLLLDASRRTSNTESNRKYFEDKSLNPEIIVDRLQRDWLTLRSASRLYLNKYAQAYDCRPRFYDRLGIGGIFSPN